MFARRFTIVSLLTILFGLVLVQIVAEAGRDRQWKPNRVVACSFAEGLVCGR